MKSIPVKILFLCVTLTANAGTLNDITTTHFIKAAKERTLHDIRYDGSYFAITYPGGDVPKNIGVCTDVVIRSFRKVGVDLQKLVHEDMSKHFSLYPSKNIWGLTRPDKNIDHRRVPNLLTDHLKRIPSAKMFALKHLF